jgi:hypothetical protein
MNFSTFRLAAPAIPSPLPALHINAMIRVAVATRRRNAPDEILVRRMDLAREYGATAELAHETVLLCLDAATHPMLADYKGRMRRISRKRLVAVAVWSEA